MFFLPTIVVFSPATLSFPSISPPFLRVLFFEPIEVKNIFLSSGLTSIEKSPEQYIVFVHAYI